MITRIQECVLSLIKNIQITLCWRLTVCVCNVYKYDKYKMTVITHQLFTFLLHSGAQFYGLHFEFVEKETRKQELCLHGNNMFGWQLSQLSSLLQDNITKDNKLPAADGAVVDGGLFANSFLSKFSMLSMLYWESGSDDQILSAIILDLWSRFLLRVSTSSRHIQCNFAFTHFLWVAVGCSVILGRIAPALLQATTEGSITWNHEQLWWSQASELCHYVPVMLPAVQIRKAAWLQCGHGGCCSAAGDNGNGNRRWSAYKVLTKDPAVTTCH